VRDYNSLAEKRRDRELRQRLDDDTRLARTLQRRRRIAAASGVFLVASILAIVGFFIKGGFVDLSTDQTFTDSNYASQVAAIAQARDTLIQLDAVLAGQKQTLEDRERLLGKLQGEQESLNKVLSVDRAAIEALFEQQQRRYERDVWAERGVGFVLGVLSGLLTALILHWAKLWSAK
jgi:septal ring factor EnvC (AmiA/AmiB activator)